MNTYKTIDIARIMNVHPNTVRLYERVGLIAPAERRPNGYRVFTDLHLAQFSLAKIALRIEYLRNGLRKRAVEIIKVTAACDFDRALRLAHEYLAQIHREQRNAEEALMIAETLLRSDKRDEEETLLTRKKAADCLGVSIDSLRNWEMNGLLTVKRKQNGYRVYASEDIRMLKIIRSLRCANYSLASILHLLSTFSRDPSVDIRGVIDTPPEDDITFVCDKLLTSLSHAERNARDMITHLTDMKSRFQNPTL